MTTVPETLSRRTALVLAASAFAWPAGVRAATVLEITWEDLIPPGVPYSQIVGMGQVDWENDRWLPEFDEHALKFNEALEGRDVRLPGYIIPIAFNSEGVTQFILVPYVGACLHVPPPPPNQLVLVSPVSPWQQPDLWQAVWVTGALQASPATTELAQIGYRIELAEVEIYEW